MRNHLAKFLLLVMTLSGIVMPIYAYAHGMPEIQDSLSIDADTQHGTDSESISCDHCCHFSAHFLGFTTETALRTEQISHSDFISYSSRFLSYILGPPGKPPKFI